MAQKIEGSVSSVAESGNLVTDISAADLEEVPKGSDEVRVTCGEHETYGIYDSTSGHPEMTFMAVLGEGGQLELTVVGDNARMMLGEREGTAVTVSW